MESEPDVSAYDTLMTDHGKPACANCGGLLALARREGRPDPSPRTLAAEMLPKPAADIDMVQCASCGKVLWTADNS